MHCFLSSALEKSEELKDLNPHISILRDYKHHFSSLMYQAKSLTGTALGSRSTLRFSGCCGKKGNANPAGVRSWIVAPVSAGQQLMCERGSSCAGTERWHSSGCWCRQPSGPLALLFSASLSFTVFLPEALVVFFLSSLRFGKSVRRSTEDTTTFSLTPLGPCNSPAAVPHWTGSSDKPGVLLYIHLHTLLYPARELITHNKHFAAAGLMPFQEGTTGNARPYLHWHL